VSRGDVLETGRYGPPIPARRSISLRAARRRSCYARNGGRPEADPRGARRQSWSAFDQVGRRIHEAVARSRSEYNGAGRGSSKNRYRFCSTIMQVGDDRLSVVIRDKWGTINHAGARRQDSRFVTGRGQWYRVGTRRRLCAGPAMKVDCSPNVETDRPGGSLSKGLHEFWPNVCGRRLPNVGRIQ